MATYIPLMNFIPQLQAADSTNATSSTLEFYDAGTSTPQTVYSDSSGTSLGTSVTLNSSGYPESGGNVVSIWRDASAALKIVHKDSGAATIWTMDNIPADGDSLFSEQTLTDQANIAWNLADGSAKVTLAGNRTLSAPTNLTAGRLYTLRVIQSSGSNTLSWNAAYQFAGSTAPTLSTGAGDIDVFTFYCDGSALTLVASALNVG